MVKLENMYEVLMNGGELDLGEGNGKIQFKGDDTWEFKQRQPARVGVAGTGMQGKNLSRALRGAGDNPTTVFYHSEGGLRSFLGHHNLAGITDAHKFVETDPNFGDYALGLKDLDQVIIATVNRDHVPMGILAANAGKHIMMEKPIAPNASKLEEFMQAAIDKKVAVELNSQYRKYRTVTHFINPLIKSETLGKLKGISGQYIQGWQDGKDNPIGWRPIVEVAGFGKLMYDLGPHVLHTALDAVSDGDNIATISDFSGEFFTKYTERFKLKGEHAESFANSDAPPSHKRPDLYNKMDMLSEEFSHDDFATGRGKIRTAAGYTVDLDVTLSQVTAARENDMQLAFKFEKGTVYWGIENPNQVYIETDEGKWIYERGDTPGYIDLPGGHAHGHVDASTIAFNGLAEARILGPDGRVAYTKRNLKPAHEASKAIDEWISSPSLIKLYNEAQHGPLADPLLSLQQKAGYTPLELASGELALKIKDVKVAA